MNLTLVTDADSAQEPIQVSDVELQLNIASGAATANLQQMITAARLEAEKENGRELAAKQFKLVLDRFPRYCWTGFGLTPAQYNEGPYNSFYAGQAIELLDPLVSVASFTCTKSDGTVVTLVENTDFLVDTLTHPGRVMPLFNQQWPTDDLAPNSPIAITFTAGFAPSAVPSVIKNGMLALITEWYENRLPFTAVRFVAEMPFSVRSAFQNDKLWKF